MSTFRECRSMFDAAVKSYQSGDLANARAAFGRLTVENPDMSDGWLGLLACGDHHLDTLAGAHQHSEALYSETRRVGLTDGELSAVVMAPMYLGLRVWSRATIGLAYASALIIADRHDEAAATLDDPVITEDTGAAQYRQFVMATLFHKTRSWSNLLKVTEISPPSGATDVRDEVADAVAALASTAAASLGQFQFALELAEQVSTTNPRVTADVTLTRAWCLRELGDDDAARVALSATTTGDAPRTNTTAEQAGSPQPKFRHPYDDGRDLLVARRRPPAGDGWRKAVTKMTFGRVNPEPRAKREQTDELIQRICAPLADVHKLAFVSAKGGVGKTTMTVLVGNAVARLRGDRVMAVDVDADLGDLSARFSERGGPQTNIEHFVSSQHTKRYADVRVHTVMNKDRLEMLGAQNDPRSTYKFGPEDYGAAMQILETHCNVILLDCGTPVNGPLFSNILNDVTGLVVVASEDVRGVEERWSLWTGWGRMALAGCFSTLWLFSTQSRKPGHLWIAGPPKTSSGSAFRISFGFPTTRIWPRVWRSISALSSEGHATPCWIWPAAWHSTIRLAEYGPVARTVGKPGSKRCVRSDDGLVETELAAISPTAHRARRHAGI